LLYLSPAEGASPLHWLFWVFLVCMCVCLFIYLLSCRYLLGTPSL
jgi:hypothetical protein